jgi:hypothetical protein
MHGARSPFSAGADSTTAHNLRRTSQFAADGPASPAVDLLRPRWQSPLDIPQMIVDPLAVEPVTIAQFTPHVFSRPGTLRILSAVRKELECREAEDWQAAQTR